MEEEGEARASGRKVLCQEKGNIFAVFPLPSIPLDFQRIAISDVVKHQHQQRCGRICIQVALSQKKLLMWKARSLAPEEEERRSSASGWKDIWL